MTAACGTTAPVLSEIVPVSSPVTRELCAINGVERNKTIASCIKAARTLWPLNTKLLILEVQRNSRMEAHVDVLPPPESGPRFLLSQRSKVSSNGVNVAAARMMATTIWNRRRDICCQQLSHTAYV